MRALAVFSPDRWYEILDTIRRNKLRTLLTALSVAWGIFMLVILLAAGNGLRNSVAYDFRDDAVNSLWMWAGETSMPHRGHAVGRSVAFTNRDYQRIRDTVPGVERITGRFFLRGNLVVSRGNKNTSFNVRACHPDHRYIEKSIMVAGRFIDDLDQAERRKVAVIGVEVARFLFDAGEDPLGQWIKINGIQYLVIGVFEDEGGEGELRNIYIPIATAQMAYGGADSVHQIMFTIGDATIEESQAIEAIVRESLAAEHDFDPADKRALRIRNNLQQFADINQVFDAIELFVWFIGAGTILAGIVGVSNIMLISVKERTKEIGVRTALGATAGAIVGQILQESIFLTAVAGYAGLVAGVGLIELFLRYAPPVEFMRDPAVDLRVVVIATVLLVISGALAGYFPARRAARVDPVVALRDE